MQVSHVNCVELDAPRVTVVAGVGGSVVVGSGTKRRERERTPHDCSQTGMSTLLECFFRADSSSPKNLMENRLTSVLSKHQLSRRLCGWPQVTCIGNNMSVGAVTDIELHRALRPPRSYAPSPFQSYTNCAETGSPHTSLRPAWLFLVDTFSCRSL